MVVSLWSILHRSLDIVLDTLMDGELKFLPVMARKQVPRAC